MLNVTAGVMDVLDRAGATQRTHLGLEYRFRSFSRWRLVPAIGYAIAFSGANFLYGDLRRDFWLGDCWAVSPSFGIGSFEDGGRIELGQRLEFRSGLELVYRFRGRYRIGAAIVHLSNGGLSERNPGTEALLLGLSAPVGGL